MLPLFCPNNHKHPFFQAIAQLSRTQNSTTSPWKSFHQGMRINKHNTHQASKQMRTKKKSTEQKYTYSNNFSSTIPYKFSVMYSSLFAGRFGHVCEHIWMISLVDATSIKYKMNFIHMNRKISHTHCILWLAWRYHNMYSKPWPLPLGVHGHGCWAQWVNRRHINRTAYPHT